MADQIQRFTLKLRRVLSTFFRHTLDSSGLSILAFPPAHISWASPLDEQEAIIRKGQDSFLDTALAVMTICDNNLFMAIGMEKYPYFLQRWDMQQPVVSRYRSSGVLIQHLKKKGFEKLPKNESQCRELLKAGELEDQEKAWQNCIDIKDLTAQKIAAEVAKLNVSEPTEEDAAEQAEELKQRSAVSTIRLTIELPGHTDKDRGYWGVWHGVTKVSDDVFQVEKNTTRDDIYGLLAKWQKRFDVKNITIAFTPVA